MWLDNPPFKSKNLELKKKSFIAIMKNLSEMKPDVIDNKMPTELDAKRITTLLKYIFKGYDMLDKKDQGKI